MSLSEAHDAGSLQQALHKKVTLLFKFPALGAGSQTGKRHSFRSRTHCNFDATRLIVKVQRAQQLNQRVFQRSDEERPPSAQH